MGIGMALVAFAIVGTVLAGITGIVIAFITALITRGAPKRRNAIIAAIFFPFACLGRCGAIFGFQAIMNEDFFHRDAGLGDAWQCPLPNGYGILMIDTTDYGWAYNPKTQPARGVSEQEDAPFSVRLLQVDRNYFLGRLDSKAGERESANTQRIDAYFLIDTDTNKRLNFPDYQSLQVAFEPLGIRLNLEPIATVYRRYRFTWFDVIADLLFILPCVVTSIFLVRWILGLRNIQVSSTILA
jgi:hypothetical protein